MNFISCGTEFQMLNSLKFKEPLHFLNSIQRKIKFQIGRCQMGGWGGYGIYWSHEIGKVTEKKL